ncbi:hypothetical protein PV325_005996 [Microctonus aethiopoides]|uniref:Uncharacterized protein n=1 Tax=Microctonus aethiopoides TaxID=144406 RepID=A0AA39KL93_9HYME|nr:hypothetical protein PV325_005996 [Microctonus aethiopoides]KAK0081796.1 hypothetical protein PV326_007485 [Microctonus aethiopoides]KAK0165653.1 hypothetical protein PV328_004155 [Microctonus aethiopoides]
MNIQGHSLEQRKKRKNDDEYTIDSDEKISKKSKGSPLSAAKSPELVGASQQTSIAAAQEISVANVHQ